MDDVKIVLRMSRARYDTLKVYLYKAGKSLETELNKTLMRIYEENVPQAEREETEKQEREDYITREWNLSRVGALRICANGKEHFLVLGSHNSFLSLTRTFCTIKEKIGRMPFESLCQYFSFGKPSDAATFEIYCTAIENNSRIYGLYDFDADKGIVRVREYDDGGWRHYDLTGVMDRMDYVSCIPDISVRKTEEVFKAEADRIALLSPQDNVEALEVTQL